MILIDWILINKSVYGLSFASSVKFYLSILFLWQLYQLRALQSSPAYADEPIPMCNNVRALQELNGREIDKNFQT